MGGKAAMRAEATEVAGASHDADYRGKLVAFAPKAEIAAREPIGQIH